MYTDQYFLCEELYIIKASNSIEEETLLKNINNNKLKDLKIKRLINNNKEDSDLNNDTDNNQSNNNSDNDINFIKFPLPQIQV